MTTIFEVLVLYFNNIISCYIILPVYSNHKTVGLYLQRREHVLLPIGKLRLMLSHCGSYCPLLTICKKYTSFSFSSNGFIYKCCLMPSLKTRINT